MGEGRMDGAERREQLLDTARTIVLSEGFYSVTIERVARDGEISRPLLYKQFGSLAGLVTALVDRETATALDGLNQAIAGMGRTQGLAAETMRDALCAMMDATTLAPLSWRILLNPPQGGPAELYERIAAGRALARDSVELLLKSVLHEVHDIEVTARLVHLILEDLVRLHLSDPVRYPRERMVSQLQAGALAELAGASWARTAS